MPGSMMASSLASVSLFNVLSIIMPSSCSLVSTSALFVPLTSHPVADFVVLQNLEKPACKIEASVQLNRGKHMLGNGLREDTHPSNLKRIKDVVTVRHRASPKVQSSLTLTPPLPNLA